MRLLLDIPDFHKCQPHMLHKRPRSQQAVQLSSCLARILRSPVGLICYPVDLFTRLAQHRTHVGTTRPTRICLLASTMEDHENNPRANPEQLASGAGTSADAHRCANLWHPIAKVDACGYTLNIALGDSGEGSCSDKRRGIATALVGGRAAPRVAKGCARRAPGYSQGH